MSFLNIETLTSASVAPIFLFLLVNVAYSSAGARAQSQVQVQVQSKDTNNIAPAIKKEIKYEDKYLDKFFSMPNEYLFTDEELKLEQMKIKELEMSNTTLALDNAAEARKYIINTKLDRLSSCVLLESTPLGNVFMIYNRSRETFEYYSDHSIPYRYLETICRKYVITFHCKPLYVVMESELKEYEKKMDETKRLAEEKEKDPVTNKMNKNKKKSVFTKFKSYNKEAGTGHVNIAVPPKNSIPNLRIDTKNSNEPVLLKENVNRYLYQGKAGNYAMLQKVSRKIDKKAAMTFAEFKKLQHKN